MVKDGLAMRHGKELTWSQVVMAANTPMLLKAGLVEGNTDAGVLASGQVAGILDDLPSCAELMPRIVAEAIEHLRSRHQLSSSEPSPNSAKVPLPGHREQASRGNFHIGVRAVR